MPLTGIIDKIDALFSNGQPLSVIKPFLVTLRDQAESLELRVRTLDSDMKNEILAAENKSLRENLTQAEAKIKQLESPTKPSNRKHQDRDDEQDKIMLLLMKNDGLSVETIASQNGIGIQVAKHHVGELWNDKLVMPDGGFTYDDDFVITSKGRAYLHERGLLR